MFVGGGIAWPVRHWGWLALAGARWLYDPLFGVDLMS